VNLQWKSALETGGAHRDGKAISLGLASACANVAVNYNQSHDAAQDTAAEIRRLGVRALAIQADVSDPSQVAAMIDTTAEDFGGWACWSTALLVSAKRPFQWKTSRIGII
jgi:NAD(P)-dependent dehydrogenase (short-subunit alcohol dehydrogenase family)